MIISQSAFPLLLLLLFVGPAGAADGDTWAISGEPTAKVEDRIEKWCEVGGNKTRYSNIPVPGYSPCGDLNAARTCDPNGRRFIGAGPSPYAFLDCSKGPRIQVVSQMTLPPGSFSETVKDVSPKELTWAERKSKELDDLLNGKSTKNKKTAGAKAPKTDLLDLSAISQALKAVQNRNQQLEELLRDP